MTTIADVCRDLENLAPLQLAADWDNVGLLVGDKAQQVSRVMTCLTVTDEVAEEAIFKGAELIVTHHPLPFHPLKRLTADQPTGRVLLALIRAAVAIYSPHTAFDSAATGINQQLAEGLGLTEIQPLVPASSSPGSGAGRCGQFPDVLSLGEVAARVKEFLQIAGLHVVGDLQTPISRAAVACGSAGSFLEAAIQQDCQMLVTGETRLHTCYEALAQDMCLLLPGHYASERFGVQRLAGVLAERFPNLTIWFSEDDTDPLRWV